MFKDSRNKIAKRKKSGSETRFLSESSCSPWRIYANTASFPGGGGGGG